MKSIPRIQIIVVGLALLTGTTQSMAQFNPFAFLFTYEGRLNDTNGPVNGLYDLSFQARAITGLPVGQVVTTNGVPVTNGLFKVHLPASMVGSYYGDTAYLELSVRATGSTNPFTALSPWQPLTPAPYALWARNTAFATTVDNSAQHEFNGTVTFAPYAGSAVSFSPQDSESPPFVVGSSWRVDNLNADLLDGLSGDRFWQLGGNTGSIAGIHFLGTRDNQPVELKVNNLRALRLESVSGNPPNVIGGTADNFVTNAYGVVVGGGQRNYVRDSSTNAVILGGLDNRISPFSGWSSIGGGRENTILERSVGSVIAGGYRNQIQTNARNASIGGGLDNAIFSGSPESTIAGGIINRIHPTNVAATVGGGINNQIYSGAGSSTIAGGNGNAVNAGCSYGTIGGGAVNFINGIVSYGTIGGGYANTVRGESATVPGGEGNLAAGRYSFAAGRAAQAMHDSTFVWSDGSDFLFPSTASNQFLIRASRGVGIGLTSPQEQLHVAGRRILLQGVANEQAYLGADGGGADVEIGSVNLAISRVTLWNHGYGGLMDLNVRDVYARDVYARDIRAYSSLTIDSGANPATLRIQSAQGFGSGRVEFWSDPPGSPNEWRPGFVQSEDAGNFTGQLTFYVNGSGFANRQGAVESLRLSNGVAIVKVLTITGGADLAEPFDMSGSKIPEGAVVVIDEASPGKLKLSNRAYDHRVAGIVSGANGVNPGLTLSQQSTLGGGQNVALSGRVYALADASDVPIQPGDLLTTSATPGHCMKATDREQASGAIIGKAMSALATSKGMVLVLVSLQ